MIGTTLGNFEITSRLGKGGMGEVYRARDTKLGRDVAIKVLPEEFARDESRVARFQREAKLLASLNHPNIAAIYGLEESSGTNFLVLELVEGETLAERIAGIAGVLAGSTPAGTAAIEETLKIAQQIADALEAAHEKGVIHRDLKPANIKVTPEGKVKVLDFGLAKAFAKEQADLNLTNSPTLSNAATQQGVILGTAAYMSPEQARGRIVDKRTDIWAFGCVLFEMLTGQAAFRGEDITEILASIVKNEANLDLLPSNIHPGMREVISRCLQKALKKRSQDIGDARYELEKILADPFGALLKTAMNADPPKKSQTMLLWFTAGIVLTAIVAGLVAWSIKPAESKQVARFDYFLPADVP
jgi:eukaryotic-like serine/threonine-protein kinase